MKSVEQAPWDDAEEEEGKTLDWFSAQRTGELVEHWDELKQLLPADWERQAKLTHAFQVRRGEGFANPETLLRVMLMHVAQGASLRMTAQQAAAGGLVKVCDVALLKRLRQCSDWFGWMTQQLVGELVAPLVCAGPPALAGHQLRLVDGSVVCGLGGKGAQWRLHYSLDLPQMRCREVRLTTHHEAESLAGFRWQAGDIAVADRNFAKTSGIAHVLERQADVIVRAMLHEPCLHDEHGKRIAPLALLRGLPEQGIGDWPVWLQAGPRSIPLRLVAWKMPSAQAQQARERVRKYGVKRQQPPRPDTLEAAGYVVLLTSLMSMSASTVLALYRMRWQIEVAFKRLKSLLQLGALKKTDSASARAWLQGKLLVACLIEKMIVVGDLFSPRASQGGRGERRAAALPMA